MGEIITNVDEHTASVKRSEPVVMHSRHVRGKMIPSRNDVWEMCNLAGWTRVQGLVPEEIRIHDRRSKRAALGGFIHVRYR